MKLRALKCPKCKYIIFSRSHHDYHCCPCGSIAIDGGFEYCRVSFDPKIMKEYKLKDLPFVEIDLDATKKDLYDDWNESKDKYGLIAPNDISFK
jgi:hypothetical protein